MSRAEVINLIGTIAKSGTAGLLKKLKASKDTEASQNLIGQFVRRVRRAAGCSRRS